jgi:hypothetical protein
MRQPQPKRIFIEEVDTLQLSLRQLTDAIIEYAAEESVPDGFWRASVGVRSIDHATLS